MEGNKIHRDREMKCDFERVGCDHYYVPAFLGTISLSHPLVNSFVQLLNNTFLQLLNKPLINQQLWGVRK